jgi:hypothetical protein
LREAVKASAQGQRGNLVVMPRLLFESEFAELLNLQNAYILSVKTNRFYLANSLTAKPS